MVPLARKSVHFLVTEAMIFEHLQPFLRPKETDPINAPPFFGNMFLKAPAQAAKKIMLAILGAARFITARIGKIPCTVEHGMI